MKLRVKRILGIAARLPDGPTGQATRHLDHVVLRVAGVHSNGVKLHDLAAIILVQAAVPLFLLLARAALSSRHAHARILPRWINAAENSVIARAAHRDFLLTLIECN